MPATIKLKNGSGVPLSSDLVQGEPALDLINKRLYTEDSGGSIIEIGVSPSELAVENNATIGGTLSVAGDTTISGTATIDGLSVGKGNNAVSTNTAVGISALDSVTTGSANTAYGNSALSSVTTGAFNTATGNFALSANTGNLNAAFGHFSLRFNTSGNSNTAFGAESLLVNTTGFSNTAVGSGSLNKNTNGDFNVAVGKSALDDCTTGSKNIQIGAGGFPVFNVTTHSNRIVIGETTATNAYVQVSWTVVSDERDKTDFAEVPHGLDFVKQLQPTCYRYKETRESTEGHGPLRYGFKAQDVLALEGNNPVIVDNENPDKLMFNDQSLMAVLVNAIKDQQAIIDDLRSRVTALEGA